MKRNLAAKFYLQAFSLLLAIILFPVISGCIAGPAMTSAMAFGTGAAAGTIGSGVYNSAQDEKDLAKAASSVQAPISICFVCNPETAKNKIIETLVESGETVEVSTEGFIKTAKKLETKGLGAISSWTGKSEIKSAKSITINKEKRLTRVMVKVDVYRRTGYTEETKKEWPEVEAKIRRDFFNLLSQKLKLAKS